MNRRCLSRWPPPQERAGRDGDSRYLVEGCGHSDFQVPERLLLVGAGQGGPWVDGLRRAETPGRWTELRAEAPSSASEEAYLPRVQLERELGRADSVPVVWFSCAASTVHLDSSCFCWD